MTNERTEQIFNKDSLIKVLTEFLGDSEGALTPENFSQHRSTIEKQIFPSAQGLGITTRDIRTDYDVELLQSSHGPDRPSSGRLGYIKEHLRNLLERVKAYEG